MPALKCAAHPGRPAEFRCDGCSKPLCGECVDEGHRLLFCRLCGERALPLDPAGAATTPARRQVAVRASAARYGFGEALGYPFRGVGAYAFWAYVALLAVFHLIRLLIPFGGCLLLIPQLLILMVIPGFLFAIARTTAEGENELPDWPDFDPWNALGEVLQFLVIALFSSLPAIAVFHLSGCEPVEVLLGRAPAGACAAALVLGLAAAVALWIPAFGATAVFGTPWLLVRLDLHLRAALVNVGEYAVAVFMTATLLVVSQLLPALLSAVPLAGLLLGDAVSVYALFTGAHLAGVFFRRHADELEELYLR